MSSPTAPAEIEFGALYRQNLTSGSTNFTNFRESIDQYVVQAALAQEVASLKNTIHDRPTTL